MPMAVAEKHKHTYKYSHKIMEPYTVQNKEKFT